METVKLNGIEARQIFVESEKDKPMRSRKSYCEYCCYKGMQCERLFCEFGSYYKAVSHTAKTYERDDTAYQKLVSLGPPPVCTQKINGKYYPKYNASYFGKSFEKLSDARIYMLKYIKEKKILDIKMTTEKKKAHGVYFFTIRGICVGYNVDLKECKKIAVRTWSRYMDEMIRRESCR